MKKRIVDIILAAAISAVLITGCGAAAVTGSAATSAAASSASAATVSAENAASGTYTSTSGGASTTEGVDVKLKGDYSDKALDADWSEKDADAVISFDGDEINVSGSGASVSGTVLTISDKGTYVISGTLKEGQIVIDNENDENIRLILNGVDITCSTDAAIKALNAKNVYITLADGTANTVTDTRSASDSEDEDTADAAIYAKCDLIINGSGTLNVTGGMNDGIKSKDDIAIISGTINVKAADDGIVGKESVSVKDGTINVSCEDDCIKSSEDEDSTKGYIIVDGGTFTLASNSGHGFNSVFAFVMNDGKVDITNSNEGIQSLNIVQNGGDINVVASDDGVNVSDKRASASSSDNSGQTSAVDTAVQTDDTDTYVETTAYGKGGGRGTMSGNGMPQMGHGPQMQGGSISGNGMHERGTMSGNGMPDGGKGNFGGGGMGGGSMENADGCLVINGGTLTVKAGGDGLDSNGDILINGGTTTVIGPTGDGDTAIDKNGVWEQDGGVVYAQGSSGMVESVDADISSGTYVSTTFSSAVAEGTEITVTDSDGNKVMSFTSEEAVPFVYFSSPDLKEGASYTITAGDQSATVTEGEMSSSGMGGGMR